MAQRLFRSDDSAQWIPRYGNGGAGAFAPGSITDTTPNTSVVGNAAQQLATCGASTGFVSGDLVWLEQTQGSNAGLAELNQISSIVGTGITFVHNLINTYVGGAQMYKLFQYSSINIASVTLTAQSWGGGVGGIFVLLCSGVATITGTVNLAGLGFRGPASSIYNSWNNCGEGTGGSSVGNPGTSGSPNGNGAGAGHDAVGGNAGCGAGGGQAAAGSDGPGGNQPGGVGGISVGTADLANSNLGGAGGAGGAQNTGPGWVVGGTGGSGGGKFILIAPTIIATSATINLNGTPGTNGQSALDSSAQDSGAGGGGSGGSADFKGQVVSVGAGVTASLGAGGTTPQSSRTAGGGAAGRLNIDYAQSVSGNASTAPVANTRQDNILYNVAESFGLGLY